MSYGSYGPPGGAPPGYGSRGMGPGGPGGFSAGMPLGPPPGADPQLWSWFSAVDTDGSGQVSSHELERALINGDWTPFDLDTVKLLMSIFDTDHSGSIGFNEFVGLWKYIKDWQGVFRHFDRDGSGSIDGGELTAALSQFGFNLNPNLIGLIERKYDIKAGAASGPYGRSPGITFDRFVRACVVVRQTTESFKRFNPDRNGWVSINYDQYMDTVLRLP